MKKNIISHIASYISVLMLCLISGTVVLTSCSSDNEPFITASEFDAPRILNTDIPEWSNGKPGTLASISRDANFTFTVIVTPMDYTQVEWFLDERKIAEGKTIDQSLLAGDYLLKIVATTTKGLQTSRICRLVVRPSEGDPVLSSDALARLVASGARAAIQGENLAKISKVTIGTVEVSGLIVDDTTLQFLVPEGLADGEYALVLTDTDGMSYGAGKVTVSSSPLVNTNVVFANAGKDVTLNGVNLDNIASIKVGDTQVQITKQEFSEVVFTCPNLAAGEYPLSMQSKDGKEINYNGSSTCTIVITAETTLWEGTHNVTWGTPFDGLKTTMKNLCRSGSVVRLYVTGNGQGTAATGWWNNILTGKGDPERGDIIIQGDMVLEFVLTDYSMEIMEAQEGFLVVGNGFTLKKITVQ